MAKLTSAARKRMAPSQFALPGGRFPVNDKIHDEKALQLAPRARKAGNISASQEATIEAIARRKLAAAK